MSTPTVTSQDPTKPPEQPEVELPVTAADEAREEAHVEAEAEKSHERLFKWSQWVHVGAWAQECEKRLTGDCTDEEHFHAWIRLPNPFQIRDITAKARAARARKKEARAGRGRLGRESHTGVRASGDCGRGRQGDLGGRDLGQGLRGRLPQGRP
jgi:hypothetical protein